MDRVTFLFAVAVLLAGGLATIAVWAPRRLVVKLAAVGAAAAFMPVAYAAMTELLSRPKPVAFEWGRQAAEQAQVLGSKVVEGEAIFLLLDLPGASEPRSYALPWRRELAEQLQGAQEEAEKGGGSVIVDQPFDDARYESSLDDREKMFYAAPPPAPPAKTVPEPPRLYQRRG